MSCWLVSERQRVCEREGEDEDEDEDEGMDAHVHQVASVAVRGLQLAIFLLLSVWIFGYLGGMDMDTWVGSLFLLLLFLFLFLRVPRSSRRRRRRRRRH